MEFVGLAAVIGGISVDDALVHAGSGGNGFKGGTGAVESVGCTVKQRGVLGVEDFLVIGLVLAQIVGGRCCHAENTAVLGIQHYQRTAGNLAQTFGAVVPQAVKIADEAVQNFLQLSLKLAVDGELHGVTGLYRLGDV